MFSQYRVLLHIENMSAVTPEVSGGKRELRKTAHIVRDRLGANTADVRTARTDEIMEQNEITTGKYWPTLLRTDDFPVRQCSTGHKVALK